MTTGRYRIDNIPPGTYTVTAWHEGAARDTRSITIPAGGGVDRRRPARAVMWTASSLSNRIFLACTLLATLSLGFAFSFVNAKATSEAEDRSAPRACRRPPTLADQHRDTTLTDTLTRLARLVADLPKLKAAVGHRRPTDRAASWSTTTGRR